MALTATPSSALLPTPSWDETIVPALRKRLEGESRVLARRISAASIASIEENSPNHPKSISSFSYSSRDQNPSPTFSPRPSGIPRPSLQASRPSVSENRATTPTSTRATNGATSLTKRDRTLSQPRPSDRNNVSLDPKYGPPLPTSSASRSASPNVQGRPAADIKPTRIPVARTRTASMSSHGHTFNGGVTRSESRSGAFVPQRSPPAPEASLNLVAEQHEPALLMDRYDRSLDDLVPRPSTDSEERPFEHWYRGEVSRNGGVGELRVGRRMEMLDIANFGHKVASASAMNDADQRRSGGKGRRRAGSTGGARGSFYMEADANGGTVLDEAPLTDLEVEVETESEPDGHLPPRSASALGLGDSLTPTTFIRERTASRATQRDTSTSRIPTPTLSRDPPRTPTPTMSATPLDSSQSTPRTPTQDRKQSLPRSQSATQPKRRAKSPAEVASSAKKTKKAPVSKHKDEEKRRSVAEYPVPADGDMAYAIPTWTQPVPPGGNWDEVVLPAVARKKGLDEHYTQADGSPQQKKRQSWVPEPAPGTFGYDYSKYRPIHPNDIPMDEFGQRPETVDEEKSPSPPKAPVLHVDTSVRTRTHAPPSPAPFSRYLHPAPAEVEHAVASTADIAVQPSLREPAEEEDAGCCKCLIM